ncbi:MAG TPA: hypothetical protein H9680_05550 [Firmicutes bacterium]|nr:hypothetical protein [Bacillota bacterium]
MFRLSPAAVLLAAALILTMAAGCAAPSSRSPASREESSPALSQEAPPEEEPSPASPSSQPEEPSSQAPSSSQERESGDREAFLASLTQVAMDKEGPGDLGYRFDLTEAQQEELARLLRPQEWQAVDPPQMGIGGLLTVVSPDGSRGLTLSPWEESTLLLLWDGEETAVFQAPAQAAQEAEAFVQPFREEKQARQAQEAQTSQLLSSQEAAASGSWAAMTDQLEAGAQEDLDAWLALLDQREEVQRIAVSSPSAPAPRTALPAETVDQLLDHLAAAGGELALLPDLGNPATGGAIQINAYGAEGLLWQASFDNGWMTVQIPGGEKGLVFDSEAAWDAGLAAIDSLLSGL